MKGSERDDGGFLLRCPSGRMKPEEKRVVAASQSLGPAGRRARASPPHTDYPELMPTGASSLSDLSVASHPRGAWTFKNGVRKLSRRQRSGQIRAGPVKNAVATQRALLICRSQGTRKTPQGPGGLQCKHQPERRLSERLRTTQKYSIMLLFLYHGK